jgi:XTP/dITP diphosphohydrolase
MRVLLATHNAHKLFELRALFEGSELEIVSLDAYPDIPEAPEDHDTFEANALQKAHFVHERTGVTVVADDSGIEIEALDWAPGVHSKRFTPEGSDETNNARVLRELEGVANRRARYRCAMAVVIGTQEKVVMGEVYGTIGQDERGEGGFGYDPLFWPDAYPGRTMAEVSLEEKNRISHRARAFSQLPSVLKSLSCAKRPPLGE